LPADADLAAAFSIPVSVKPAAGARWAIRDGPHKNMQAGKKRDSLLVTEMADAFGQLGVLGRICLQSELYHKYLPSSTVAFEMHLLVSWLRTVLVYTNSQPYSKRE